MITQHRVGRSPSRTKVVSAGKSSETLGSFSSAFASSSLSSVVTRNRRIIIAVGMFLFPLPSLSRTERTPFSRMRQSHLSQIRAKSHLQGREDRLALTQLSSWRRADL